jgi:hypothetical protein
MTYDHFAADKVQAAYDHDAEMAQLRQRYEQQLTTMSADQLMDALVFAGIADRYGSHEDDLRLIRAEMRSRMAS